MALAVVTNRRLRAGIRKALRFTLSFQPAWQLLSLFEGSQPLHVFIVSEGVTVRYFTLSGSGEMTSSLPSHLPLQVGNMGTMRFCSCCCYAQGWPKRFHAGLTQLVSNARHKTLCLAGMRSTGNTQREENDLQSCLWPLPSFLICEMAGTGATGA